MLQLYNKFFWFPFTVLYFKLFLIKSRAVVVSYINCEIETAGPLLFNLNAIIKNIYCGKVARLIKPVDLK